MDDVIWCDECGAGLPWKHGRRVSRRRRLVAPLTVSLFWLARMLTLLMQFFIDWADKPARRRYEVERRAYEIRTYGKTYR